MESSGLQQSPPPTPTPDQTPVQRFTGVMPGIQFHLSPSPPKNDETFSLSISNASGQVARKVPLRIAVSHVRPQLIMFLSQDTVPCCL